MEKNLHWVCPVSNQKLLPEDSSALPLDLPGPQRMESYIIKALYLKMFVSFT
jgi:hypothetical protein